LFSSCGAIDRVNGIGDFKSATTGNQRQHNDDTASTIAPVDERRYSLSQTELHDFETYASFHFMRSHWLRHHR